MKYFLLSLSLAAAWAQQAPPAASADPVVLTVGNEKITRSQFEELIAGLPAQAQAQAKTPAGRKQLAEQLAELKTLAQEARAKKLDESKEVKARLALQAEQVLANAEFQALGSSDESALRAYYDAHKGEMDQVTARHILIRFKGSQVPLKLGQKDLTDEEALKKTQELRAKLTPANFSDTAKTESDDTGSGADGGSLGTFGHGQMVPEFEKAAFSMPVGQVSEPVKSAFGYHLILVEAHKTKSFEDARPEMVQKVGPEQAQKGLADLKKKVNIVYDDAYFGN
jgi:peptidyl-prolyl cis-trans isomerase C